MQGVKGKMGRQADEGLVTLRGGEFPAETDQGIPAESLYCLIFRDYDNGKVKRWSILCENF